MNGRSIFGQSWCLSVDRSADLHSIYTFPPLRIIDVGGNSLIGIALADIIPIFDKANPSGNSDGGKQVDAESTGENSTTEASPYKPVKAEVG